MVSTLDILRPAGGTWCLQHPPYPHPPYSSEVCSSGKGSTRRAAVEHRPRPQVPGHADGDTPGGGDDGAVADRCTHQQPPQCVDDRREGLVLSEPADPCGHRGQGDERTADERQQEQRHHRFLAGGSPALKAHFVVDGGTQCPEGTLLCRVVCFVVLGGWCSSACRGGAGIPLLPTRPLWRSLGHGTPRAGNGIPAGQRPGGMVGVTGFELCCLFVPNEDQVAAVLLSTRSGVPSAFLLGAPRSKRGPHHFWCGPLACGNTGRGDRI